MELSDICRQIRSDIVFQIGTFGVGHIGGSLSIVEILAVLYSKYMKFDSKDCKKEGRDRLVLSKGHAGPALYATLCNFGFFDRSLLSTLNSPNTSLPSHCDMNKTPGVDMTAGSLGQGLSCAIGMSLASRLKGDGASIYAIIGDGESQEGQIWEASMFAAHQRLDNLYAFLDYNGAQIDGLTSEVCSIDPICEKWEAFGWHTLFVENGNSCEQIDNAISRSKKVRDRPHMIIAKTIKGFGVSFVQKDVFNNHSMKISKEQMSLALKELGEI